MKLFYDTCALLDAQKEAFESGDKFYISSITINELENITNSFYDFWTAWFSSYFNQMQRYLRSIKI